MTPSRCPDCGVEAESGRAFCTACGARLPMEKNQTPSAAPAAGRPPVRKEAAPKSSLATGWRYKDESGEEQGPYPLPDFLELIAARRVTKDTPVFNFYIGEWQKCESIDRFRESFGAAPARAARVETVAHTLTVEKADAEMRKAPPSGDEKGSALSGFRNSWKKPAALTAASILIFTAAFLISRGFRGAAGDGAPQTSKRSLAQQISALETGDHYLNAPETEALDATAVESANDAVVVEWIKSANENVRAYACFRLGALGTAEALEPLQALQKDKSPFVRAAALLALGALRDAGARDVLAESLRDSEPLAAAAAVRALVLLDGPDAQGPLLERLEENPEGPFLEYLLDSLVDIGAPPDSHPLLDRHYKSLATQGKGEARPQVLEADMLQENDWNTVVHSPYVEELVRAANEIGKTNNPAYENYLRPLLVHENEKVRAAGLKAAAAVGDAGLIDDLKEASQGLEMREAEGYWETIDRIRLREFERGVADWEAFQTPPAPGREEAVIERAYNGDEQERFEAVYRLGYARKTEAVKAALLDAFENEADALRHTALQGLGRMDLKAPDDDYLHSALADENPLTVREAIEQAKRTGDAYWAETLHQMADDYGDTEIGDLAFKAAEELSK